MNVLLLIEGLLRVMIPLGVQFFESRGDVPDYVSEYFDRYVELTDKLKANYDEIKDMQQRNIQLTQAQWVAHDEAWRASVTALQEMLLNPPDKKPGVVDQLEKLGLSDKTA